MGGSRWSPEELEYLEKSWGRTAIATVAKRLGRSDNSVTLKASRLGLGGFKQNTDYVSLSCLLQCFGFSTPTKAKKASLIKQGLPVKIRRIRRSTLQMVALPDFWEWAEQHRSALDFCKLEHLMLGVEPEWVKEQRKLDFVCRRSRAKWTVTDNEHLLHYIKKGLDVCQIAKNLNRTERAVARHCDVLGWMLPVRRRNVPWTEAEKEKLLQLLKQQVPIIAIADQLGRSVNSCQGCFERLVKSGRAYAKS